MIAILKPFAALPRRPPFHLTKQEAGCFGVVLECVPAVVGAAVTAALEIPTIGIGAGPDTSGQVLVYHDLLGMTSHPHHAQVTPKFCKQVRCFAVICNPCIPFPREAYTLNPKPQLGS